MAVIEFPVPAGPKIQPKRLSFNPLSHKNSNRRWNVGLQ
ncbi:hypothetical protein F441_03907 [Phytophthora nicotianae CJ01A1]|uniref:Uncharacterized protein n=3 Tax=Phytophthora nicotianae TaxID=4792 RepID=W2ZX77_PHYNI|nr:hypothetical protein L915_03817 [Phytophthora nicotianae]ETL46354.1 hypothetical protein L916_03756 [Phytophthora nicotianae]ETP22866.1 hypothetical protein F441_03907 [Phytophthora nicotianae CJ01A1]ETP50844.1 hypothetical protein F442_03914 [Phytophthora nicotianae P10297]